ncbi:hypothetical protein, partial [Massilia genomosp. 1]|uniref:hypothetical protein n=1 Tax=Massilia genomosp. 1 TaxID=2609280 RepID=UPI0014203A77
TAPAVLDSFMSSTAMVALPLGIEIDSPFGDTFCWAKTDVVAMQKVMQASAPRRRRDIRNTAGLVWGMCFLL